VTSFNPSYDPERTPVRGRDGRDGTRPPLKITTTKGPASWTKPWRRL
jgi:hypothetical protein